MSSPVQVRQAKCSLSASVIMLIFKVRSFVLRPRIKRNLLYIIVHVCATYLTQISKITLSILQKLSCYENAAIALVCNGCTVANDAIATTLRRRRLLTMLTPRVSDFDTSLVLNWACEVQNARVS